MATHANTAASKEFVNPEAPPGGAGRWFREHLVVFFGILALIYMFIPIVVVVVFSFNNPSGSFNYTWQGFTTKYWTSWWQDQALVDSLLLSLKISVLATLAATVLGTLAAFGLVRHNFKGKSTANILIFVPMATPEVVVGSSLLVLYVSMGVPLGQTTIFIAHTVFCFSFVVVTVKARLVGLDPRLEQAAQDLYANRWQTFWRITFPLILPGIMGAAMLSFALSFDDFIITNFVSGNEVTFPMYVWGAARKALPPTINVIGTLMLVVALLFTISGRVISSRRERKQGH